MPPKLVMQTLNQLWLQLQKSNVQVAIGRYRDEQS
ncbi:hypothetical protein Pla100_13530 [Neorhodopirellula pilleata]|uniref:Uncharacterized protein n=1 Tax=Neorhodopirellula pilleata TaxID=2714738 RepID=A0A5C6AQ14_9BACT|nr:hypothetical protein Pla100_13530 [Neorhodopirellula pilleata]